jgi:hypothetical protein
VLEPVQACVRYDPWLWIRRLERFASRKLPQNTFLEAFCAFMHQYRVPGDVLAVLMNADEAQVIRRYQIRCRIAAACRAETKSWLCQRPSRRGTRKQHWISLTRTWSGWTSISDRRHRVLYFKRVEISDRSRRSMYACVRTFLGSYLENVQLGWSAAFTPLLQPSRVMSRAQPLVVWRRGAERGSRNLTAPTPIPPPSFTITGYSRYSPPDRLPIWRPRPLEST